MDSRVKRAAIRGGLIGVAFASMLATAATFNLFQPANGILVGSSSTYVTTAAAAGNITSLWSGSCGPTTYLSGSGVCSTPAGTGGGTVNSVALTMPSGFSVGGSPVTSTGTLAVTTTLSGVLKGTGSGFTTAAAADIVALFSTCSGTQYLGADGACHTSGTVSSVALADGSTSPIFTISGSPVTGSGTLTETLSTQAANLVLAGPTTGSAAQPTFRPLVAADIPLISLSSGVTGSLPFANLTITSANVIGLWTGTCNSSSYLNGAGVCTVPSGAGTVTSVGLSAPSVFAVGGTNPVTGSGTIALTFATGQAANSFLATPNGTTGAVGLRTIVAGDLPGSITSNTSGNAATATAAAASPTQCTSGQYATGVTTLWAANCAQVAYSQLSGTPSIPVGANPSASVGLSAVNGSAATFLRSDGAPALSQSITPTWTGGHTFASGIALTGATSIGPASSMDMEFSGGLASVYSLGANSSTIGGFRISLRGAGYANANNVLATSQSGAAITGIVIGDGTALPAINFEGPVFVTTSSGNPAITARSCVSSGTCFIIGMTGGTNNPDVNMNFTESTGKSQIDFSGSAGPNGSISVNGTDALSFAANRGLIVGTATGGSEGSGTLNAQGLYVNGIAVVTSAISGGKNGGGVITGTPSTCTVNFNAGGVASCNYNGVGNYTFNFTSGYFATGASCTTSAVSASAEYATSSGYSTGGSTMGAILRNSSGTPVDGEMAVTCIGN